MSYLCLPAPAFTVKRHGVPCLRHLAIVCASHNCLHVYNWFQLHAAVAYDNHDYKEIAGVNNSQFPVV